MRVAWRFCDGRTLQVLAPVSTFTVSISKDMLPIPAILRANAVNSAPAPEGGGEVENVKGRRVLTYNFLVGLWNQSLGGVNRGRTEEITVAGPAAASPPNPPSVSVVPRRVPGFAQRVLIKRRRAVQMRNFAPRDVDDG